MAAHNARRHLLVREMFRVGVMRMWVNIRSRCSLLDMYADSDSQRGENEIT